MSDTKKEKIIGIDLGTSNSAASVLVGGKPTVVPSAEGASQYGKAFPSYVAFTDDGQMLVGEPARRQAVTNPENTISAIKRSMGTDYKVTIHGKQYSPQEISAFILQKIKKDAESFLDEKVEKAVMNMYCLISGTSFSSKCIRSMSGIDAKTKNIVMRASIMENLIVGKKYFFADFLSPLMLDSMGDTLAISPIPKVIIQFVIAVAILIAARVSVECLPAIRTSPAPINIKPKFPIIMGRAMFNNSFA